MPIKKITFTYLHILHILVCSFPDCSLEYALEAASLHPAKALGIEDRKGKLDFGCDADFVFLHPETLKVQSTWIAGECVYKTDTT